MKTAKPIPGRSLGWSRQDLESHPYAKFWNSVMGPLSIHAVEALQHSPAPEPRLPPPLEAAADIPGAELQNGFTLTRNGAIHIALRTDMPGVTPEMMDWWFGWHSGRPERYKLWHPHAHVHAEWLDPPPPGARGRDRYLHHTSIVDEYIGSSLGRYAIRFIPPGDLGVSVPANGETTAICARVGLAGVPVDGGYLVHHVQTTAGGSIMRSRFWLGAPYAAARHPLLRPAMPLVRAFLQPTVEEARSLLIHCAEEMAHLAVFLPTLWREFHDLA